MQNNFLSTQIAIIIPTKDRPLKMANLLRSLAQQTVKVGRIIIADGGLSIESVTSQFSQSLPIEHFLCHPPGQIRQRNEAIKKLDDRTRLVCFLDDDLVLSNTAIERLIAYWNSLQAKTGGIAFNITNNPPFKHTYLKWLAGMSSPQMGRILKTGYNVALSPTSKNIKVEWLCGGATVWLQEIIQHHRHTEIKSRWAICEDISFSYPLAKYYNFYVCADATVLHEHVYDHTAKVDFRFYGRAATLWRMHFVISNPGLSRVGYVYMIILQIFARLLRASLRMERKELDYAVGQIDGLRIGFARLLRSGSIVDLLAEHT